MALVEPTVAAKIERMYQARARLVHRIRDAQTSRIESGEVLVFELSGHPSANFCYAWESDGHVVLVLDHARAPASRREGLDRLTRT